VGKKGKRGNEMQINKNGEFVAEATLFKQDRQWVIVIKELPEWVVDEIEADAGHGFDNGPKVDIYPQERSVVLKGRRYEN
jgi:hypothetical protein